MSQLEEEFTWVRKRARIRGCLPTSDKSDTGTKKAQKMPASSNWKAGTLPTELLPHGKMHVNLTLKWMAKQVIDNLLLESLVSTTSLESLAKGYILNCKTEGKSPKTISGYEMALRNFIWYRKQNDFLEIQKITVVHIRHFLKSTEKENNSSTHTSRDSTTIHVVTR